MFTNIKFIASGCLIILHLLIAFGSAWASATYTYTGNSFGGTQVQVSFTTTLTGAQLDNLAAGTDITGTLSAFLLSSPAPPQDQAGFPLGVHNFVPPASVQIGTNALGNITSWNISEDLFASYPAFPNENPNDFFCVYTVSTTTGEDARTLKTDHNAGFCPPTTSLVNNPGTWVGPSGSSAAVPEPASLIFVIGGFIGFAARRLRNL